MEDTQQVIEQLMGRYAWLFIIGFISLFFKGAIENFYKGILIFMGSNVKNDDIIIYKGEKARVVRKGIFKTVIYIQEEKTRIDKFKMVITNSEVKTGDIKIMLDQDYDKLD